MKFEPIAIVGSSCLLPGALDPKSFGRAVLAGEDLTSNAPEARWRMPRALRLAAMARAGVPAEVADRGGFVTGFEERFDARGFALDEAQIRALDPQVQWLLHTAREALRSADYAEPKRVRETRIGAVFGNLSYPTDHMARFVENAWLERAGLGASARAGAGVSSSDARDRFMSGLPGGILRAALGLSEPAFALDAACASSIYALKLACDRLHDGEADVMLAGAVCRVDLLNIHTGFAALRAFSRSGRSRPFHRDADGLLPAEGAAFVVLKRVRDALAAGDRILGLVRGIGLSCDGRSAGLLTPSPAGQARAIRRAYELAELSPRAISLLECHATGTVLGDAAEIESTGSVFAGLRDVPLGSVKSNIGHALTVAGMAALLKVLECFAAGERAPTLHADLCNPKLDASPFRLVTARERWEAEGGPRCAGISAFGFGGNNAHLIVQEWESRSLAAAPVQVPAASAPAAIAIVGVGVQALGAHGAAEFAAKIFGARAPVTPHDAVTLPLRGLRFSPNDLARAIPQQTVLLGAALEAVAGLTSLPRERTSVLVGMGCDTEVCRWALRLRLEGWGETWGASPEWVAAAQAAASPELTPADVLGVMPNIVANRVNSQLDLGGPSFCVSSEERSGIDALICAQRALRRGEIDAALVGAVDLNCEEANAEALRSAFGYPTPGDAAVVLVLKRLDDARAAGDEVYAVLGATAPREAFSVEVADASQPLALRAGHTHAASGLLAVATAALACAHRLQPTAAQVVPWFAPPESLAGSVRVASANGSSEVAVAVDPASAPRPLCTSPAPRIQVYAGADRRALIRALESRTPSVDGPARLVLVAPEEQLDALAHKALARLRQGVFARAGTARLGEGIFFREAALEGELSFVFAGSGGAYSGMGRELVSAFPALAQRITARFGDVSDVARSLYAEHPPAHTVSNADRLWGGSLLSQLHAEFSLRTLGLAPTAAIGFCSGETNALFAMGAWHDFAGMRDELERVHVYDRELSGEFALARAAWQKRGVRTGAWQTWRLAADATQVRAALADEPLAHLTIINAPGDVVIAGHDAACARVIARLGPEKSRQLDLNLTIHTPEMVGFADAWRAIHTRRTTPVPGVRFYTHATLSHYAPDETSAADALVGQACKTVDFPALIENAWNDGVRIFLEHGPQGGCAAWIRRTLGARPHVALALDSASSSSLLEAAYAAAELFVCGVAVDLAALDVHLARLGSPARELGPTRSYPAHWPSPRFPTIEAGARAPATRPKLKSERPTASRAEAGVVQSALAGAQRMQPAPWLPPILGADRLERPAQLAAQVGRAALVQESTVFGGAPGLTRSVAEQEITARSDRPADTRVASAQTMLRSEGSGLMRVPASAQAAITTESATHETARELHALYADLAAQQAAAYEAYLATARAAFARLLRASTGTSLHAAAPTRTQASRSEIERSPAVSSAMLQPMAASSAVLQPLAIPALAPREARAVQPEPPRVSAPPPPASVAPARDLPRIVRDSHGKGLAPTPGVARPPVGLQCSRADLETLASGRISSVFGSAFASQDGYARQVRMPEPPLLLADRVLGIEGPAGVLGRGTIWTETDIAQDAWYAHCGRIPAGIFIEAGQADLLLISWMGIDASNRSERVYRLLGCEVTFSGGLPAQGDTIRYQIEIDGHAEQNGMRLFFFHYDGRVGDDVRISVRKGQAGFFTDAELEDSKGVLFDPADYTPQAGARVDTPSASTARRFDAAQVRAFADGRPYDCFGPEFALTRSHTRSPSIEQGRLLLFDEVTEFDPKGGPWGRGYLRVTKAITPDAWFFDGHFKGDPCMPGTLMLQGTLQAMAFYLAALGYTIDRDGYRFEPVMGEPIALQCRGQVTPSSRELVAEIFVEELHDGPIPTLYAHVLGTVDGLKSLYGKRVGLRCVPDWPLTSQGRELLPKAEPKPVARIGDFPLGYASLLACAWGKPSEAFGPGYALFDGVRRCPRLPGPPYHFVSRVTQLSGPFGEPKAGIRSEFEYDVPRDAWYFGADASGAMPFAVLLEAALQPCGWTAAYRGIPMTSEEDLYFRNLEGTATAHADITPECGTLRTAVHFSSLARLGTTIIEAFDVECFRGEQRVYTMNTRFGHFPKSALAEQTGLPVSDEQRARLHARSEFSVDLSESPAAYFAAELRLPERSLLMLDRVTGFWPTAGRAGLGVVRAEKSIDPGEWFFKAHFFQDPVQPGSLGIEAMIQLLRFYAIERGLGRGMKRPRFEPLAIGRTLAWKYRGQVRPWNKLVTVDAEITECVSESDDPRRVLCVADASLWVDGARIYEAKGLALRVVESSEGDDERAGRNYETRDSSLNSDGE